MLHFFSTSMTIVWVVAMILLLIVEAATAGLTCIWFALGALAALVAALFGAQLWLQIVWFLVISIVTLILTRPLVKKYVNTRTTPTNADMVIGMEGLVTEAIDNVACTGAVAVGGKTWTARSVSDEVIPAGALVKAESIAGVKLMVRAVSDKTDGEAAKPETAADA